MLSQLPEEPTTFGENGFRKLPRFRELGEQTQNIGYFSDHVSGALGFWGSSRINIFVR
jgi:hypothetical protein